MVVADLPTASARTQRFRLGVPRDVTIAPDGARILFLRSVAGDDPMTCLWQLDVASGEEQLIADPRSFSGGAEGLSAAERALRQRMREQADGIIGYATDRLLRRAVFLLGGVPWLLEVPAAASTAPPAPVRLPTPSAAMQARLDPTGARVAYIVAGALRVIDVDGGLDRPIAQPEHDDVTYGLAEHVAGESMYRYHGYWWAPDGDRIAVSRVDTAGVQRWYLADPANPGNPPTPVAYPAAGTANADVSLWVYRLDGSDPVAVRWDRVTYEYLVSVRWSAAGLLIVVQSRDQRRVRVLLADPDTGATTVLGEETAEDWVEVVRGVPVYTDAGALVWIAASQDTWRLVVDGVPVTPPGLQVFEVADVDGDVVLFNASEESTERHLWTWSAAQGPQRVTRTSGVHAGRRAGGTTVMMSRSLGFNGERTTVLVAGDVVATIASGAQTPPLEIRPTLLRLGERALRSAILFPTGHVPGERLPVLLDPYGGPHSQVVLRIRNFFSIAQWFADQGFAVLVADGRGTPARGLAWEHAVRGDKLTVPLQDQIDALHAAAERYPDLDLSRVGIRGASYGGYLAAGAVLRRPDVFHAAVAVAAVTDPLLYDTHWMERYLGHPAQHPEVYARNALMGDAPMLSRPLLLVHGLADDNVVVAHTLRLSHALLAAGRDHRVLPLVGATHMAPTDDSGANLLRLERDFLHQALNPPVDDVRLDRR